MKQDQALQHLRDILSRVDRNSPDKAYRIAAEIRDAKNSVLEKYQPVFAPDNLDNLTSEMFRSFLLFRNNKHWGSIHRLGGWMTADMNKLRDAIKTLLDEDIDITTRLNLLRPLRGHAMIKGLGRAVITAILHVAHPDKYGVWNNTAINGMKQLGIYPDMPRNTSFGERYVLVNRIFNDYAEQLNIDLWTLDLLWWHAASHTSGEQNANEVDANFIESDDTLPLDNVTFSLEKYLHEFLVDNWDNVEHLREWALYEEDGEIVGSYYNTHDIGEIDLLAKHRNDNTWLVIELKKGQTSDKTIGQILRYMGWVRKNLAQGAPVRGMIICQGIDRRLQYALDSQPNIVCLTYDIRFALNDTPTLENMH